jgi:hypothetical protein
MKWVTSAFSPFRDSHQTLTSTPCTEIAPAAVSWLWESDAAGQTVVRWCDPLDLTANDLCARVDRVRPRDRAKDWLKEQLAGGKRRAAEIEAAARAAGIAEITLKRAKAALGIESELVRHKSEREWWWIDPALPKHDWTRLPRSKDSTTHFIKSHKSKNAITI